MELEEALIAHATANVPLAALIGQRFRPMKLDQGDPLPGIEYSLISSVPDYAHDGPVASERRYQMTVKAASYAQAKAVKKALRRAFEAFEQAPAHIGGPSGPVVSMFFENEVDIYGAEDVETKESYMIPVDYMIQLNEEI